MPNNKQQWQDSLANLITDPSVLLRELSLDMSLLPQAQHVAKVFPLRVTRSFLSRIKKGDINDPLLRQILPLGEELVKHEGYTADPLMESNVNPIPGLLHKYAGRVLVMLTSACAIHCRYCFRREFPYADNNPGRGWSRILDYLAKDESITEVILSGGDPLVVSDTLLQEFSEELVKISHITRLRIHTRIPIVLPERITDEFIDWAKKLKHKLVIVIHANHPQELNDEVFAVFKKLKQAGVELFNQSVLLKSINDKVDVLKELSEKLFSNGVIPYYLHVLDKVQGTAHFDMSLKCAKELHHQLQQLLPGYMVPRLVREDPDHTTKTIL